MRFILKSLFIYFLTIVLIDGNTPFIGKFVAKSAFATGAATADLETLTNSYQGLFEAVDPATNQLDFDKIQSNLASDTGKTALAQGQAFIKDPANRTQLATPDGQAFMALHNKFTRLNKIKKTMDNCFAEAGGKSQLNDDKLHGGLPTRIFAAAYSRPAGDIPCDPALFQADSIDSLFGGVSDVIRAGQNSARIESLNKMQNVIYQKNLEATAKTLASLKVTYSGETLDANNPPINDAGAMRLVDRVCPRTRTTGAGHSKQTHNLCSDEQRNRLKKVVLDEQARMIAARVKTYSHESAANELVSRVRGVNNVINENPFDMTDNMLFPDNIDPRTPKSQESYQKYLTSFMNMTSEGPGLLVWTDTIGERLGMRRDQDTRFMGIWGGGFDTNTQKLKPHSDAHINQSSIAAAIREAENKTISKANASHSTEIQRRKDLANHDPSNWGWVGHNDETLVDARKEDIRTLIKENPTSVGQALMENPEMSDEACLMIQDIAQETVDDGKWYSPGNLMWGALIVGGVLLGGAALIGLGMLAFAGTAAAGGAILSSLVVPSLVLGVAETANATMRARSAAAEREALRESLITGTADAQTATEFYRAMETASDAWLEAGLALGFTILDAGAVMRIARNYTRAGEATRYFMRANRIGGMVARDAKLRTLFRGLKNSIGRAKITQVMEEIIKLEDGADFVRKLKNLNIDEAKELFENGAEVCTKFCS